MTLWVGAYHIILYCWWQLLWGHLLQWQTCLLTLCCFIIIIITMMVIVVVVVIVIITTTTTIVVVVVVIVIIIIIIIFIVIITLSNSYRSISVYSALMEIPLLWSYVSVVISGILFGIFLLIYSAPQIFYVFENPAFIYSSWSHNSCWPNPNGFVLKFGILCFLILI